jgi:16S rRNA (uracil1498-N3)-methyltransferase
MTIHRFFIAPQFIHKENGTIVYQSPKLVKQIRKVLRLENGDRLDVLDGNGNIYHCTIENFLPRASHSFFQAKIISIAKIIEPTGVSFTVAMPLIKLSRFEWAIEKLTELGADKIVPVVLSRSIIKTQECSKLTRWHKIVEEAAEQSERSCPPDVSAPIQFLDWLAHEQTQNYSLRLICLERHHVQSIAEVLYNFKNMQPIYPVSCAIAVGAEGGFTEEEIEAASMQNFTPVSLGNHILRSETAALSVLAITSSYLCRNEEEC